ncbi:MAG: valine--tRNA ligase [Gemmatimonadetes bacterium]|nr:valine--tRNA ligase [Gemmatimonadota bacterium]
MAEPLAPQYNPEEVEGQLYRWWEEAGFFRADSDSDREPFTVLMPPPNVTGELHIGHALFVTLQDLLVRWKRMSGYNALWIPGTDHAGIATQMVVERELRQTEGLTRHELGREEFLRRVWDWRERAGNRILEQIRVLGASADWSRLYFTMDEGLSRAVREAFVRLYDEGLIYRADRLINWCPQDRTALSDLEVEHEENSSAELYSFAYALSDGSGEIVVATTRPETMLGDTAIAVHPDDDRYRHLIGRTVRHPFIDRAIPIVADADLVDPEFGTGAVKVTPAHDFNDFEVGRRHDLASINILNVDGTLNENGGPFAGLDRFDARRAVKQRLAELGFDRGAREHQLPLGRCQRCGTVVEPYLSLQWFVRIEPLARPAIDAVERGDTVFVPEAWTKTYMQWMENIHDWTISRQLWWGHRIPAWYAPDGTFFVARSEEEAHEKARSHYGEDVPLEQDPDVLDTWFSSGLLPFTTLGWPEKTKELKTFYPTSVMETGFDIIFFWVARMMMMGLHFMDEVPFRTVFLHAMVRDEKGEKMSKTKGNVIDPLDVTREYGADALRFTLTAMAAQGRNINLSLSRVAGYQAFTNKIWNIARFALSHVEDVPRRDPRELRGSLALADRWILSRLSATAGEVTDALGRFRFQDAAELVYGFIWGELADWYVELVKPRLYGDMGEESQAAARATLIAALDGAMRLLHPMMPFVTEAVWQRLPRAAGDPESIMRADWPTARAEWADPEAEARVAELQELIGVVRNLRAEYGIQPGTRVPLHLAGVSPAVRETVSSSNRALHDLARIGEVVFEGADGQVGATAVLRSGAEVFIPLSGIIDLDRERERLREELQRIAQALRATQTKLANENFVSRAPADVVDREREKLMSYSEQQEKLGAKLRSLEGVA